MNKIILIAVAILFVSTYGFRVRDRLQLETDSQTEGLEDIQLGDYADIAQQYLGNGTDLSSTIPYVQNMTQEDIVNMAGPYLGNNSWSDVMNWAQSNYQLPTSGNSSRIQTEEDDWSDFDFSSLNSTDLGNYTQYLGAAQQYLGNASLSDVAGYAQNYLNGTDLSQLYELAQSNGVDLSDYLGGEDDGIDDGSDDGSEEEPDESS